MAAKSAARPADRVPRFTAVHRFARSSARKILPLATMVRGKFADEALELLKYQTQRGARLLEAVIKSAMANAQDPEQTTSRGMDVSVQNLVLEDIRVDRGPIMKRIQPRARGMAYPILKRTCHITVTVTDLAAFHGGQDDAEA